MNCFNCNKELSGVAYSYADFKFFCGKSCLVKYLQTIGIVKLEIIKKQTGEKATAGEAYEEATASAWEAYEKARATAWEAYEKATAKD